MSADRIKPLLGCIKIHLDLKWPKLRGRIVSFFFFCFFRDEFFFWWTWDLVFGLRKEFVVYLAWDGLLVSGFALTLVLASLFS
jgi:hypothetical protein